MLNNNTVPDTGSFLSTSSHCALLLAIAVILCLFLFVCVVILWCNIGGVLDCVYSAHRRRFLKKLDPLVDCESIKPLISSVPTSSAELQAICISSSAAIRTHTPVIAQGPYQQNNKLFGARHS